MLVKTTRQFYDTVDDVYRHAGDEFIVSLDRYKELNGKVEGFVEEVKEAKKEDAEASDK